jgi:hypothetical protein
MVLEKGSCLSIGTLLGNLEDDSYTGDFETRMGGYKNGASLFDGSL